MRFAVLALCLIGLAVGVEAQGTSTPAQVQPQVIQAPVNGSIRMAIPGGVLTASRIVVSSRVIASNVRIESGTTVATADEAEFANAPDGTKTIYLRGNVKIENR